MPDSIYDLIPNAKKIREEAAFDDTAALELTGTLCRSQRRSAGSSQSPDIRAERPSSGVIPLQDCSRLVLSEAHRDVDLDRHAG